MDHKRLTGGKAGCSRPRGRSSFIAAGRMNQNNALDDRRLRWISAMHARQPRQHVLF